MKKLLKPGTTFVGEFLDEINKRRGKDMLVCRRLVRRQGKVMVCLLLEGPRAGQEIELTWAHFHAAIQDGETYILHGGISGFPVPFLRISDIRPNDDRWLMDTSVEPPRFFRNESPWFLD